MVSIHYIKGREASMRTVADDYDMLMKIGSGTYGEVFKAVPKQQPFVVIASISSLMTSSPIVHNITAIADWCLQSR